MAAIGKVKITKPGGTLWRLKSGKHTIVGGVKEVSERRRYGPGDLVEFGPHGPPASLRDKFEQVHVVEAESPEDPKGA